MNIWIDKTLVLLIHDRQLAEHGGSAGIRDEGLLESALARSSFTLPVIPLLISPIWQPLLRAVSHATIPSWTATSVPRCRLQNFY